MLSFVQGAQEAHDGPFVLGRQSEAEGAVAQGRKLNPNLTIKWLRTWLNNPEGYYEGLRKAGLPEE